MPYNFIPQVTSAQLLKDREQAAIAVKHSNREYEGTIKKAGDRVKILTPGKVSLFDYARNTDMADPEIIDDAAQFLDITESKAFQYYMDDVDKRQMELAQKFEDASASDAGYQIADYADSFIFKKYTEAGTTLDKTAVTSANIIAAIGEADKAMRLANVPENVKKYLEISPDVYLKMVLAKIVKDTNNSKVIDTGFVTTLFGFDIFVSNNVVTSGDTVGSISYCLARTKKAIAYAEQINDTESIRHPKRFGDIHRGLMLCGAKVVVPKELICVKITTAAEA